MTILGIPGKAGPVKIHPSGKVLTRSSARSVGSALRMLAKRIELLPLNKWGVKVVAVGGVSGSGKTWLSNCLSRIIPNSMVLAMDNWRGPLEKTDLTREEFMEVLGFEQFKADFQGLMRNGRIEKPPKFVHHLRLDQPREYEDKPLLLGDNRVIITEGALILHDRLVGLSQLRIFLDTNRELRAEHRAKNKRDEVPQGPKYGLTLVGAKYADIYIQLLRRLDRYSYRVWE